MALKRTVTKRPPVEKTGRIEEIKNLISSIDKQVTSLLVEKEELQKELLEISIKPFKIGDYCMAEVNAGKTKKVQKCLLENEGGILYLRPVKNDGELSGRHFSLTPICGKTYSDYLKPVEE